MGDILMTNCTKQSSQKLIVKLTKASNAFQVYLECEPTKSFPILKVGLVVETKHEGIKVPTRETNLLIPA